MATYDRLRATLHAVRFPTMSHLINFLRGKRGLIGDGLPIEWHEHAVLEAWPLPDDSGTRLVSDAPAYPTFH